jgi:MinD superfamily P-loop ATPase
MCRTCYVINRADINPRRADEIDSTAQSMHVPSIGRIPFDEQVVASMALGMSVVESGKGKARESILRSWNSVMLLMRA